MEAYMYTYNILIVEDDKQIADAIEIYMKNQNYGVFKAYNGQLAIEIFEKEVIHLIIMDVMMPVMDGFTAIMKIRQNSTVPIIVLSAKSEDMDKIAGLNIGADDYVTKPFNPIEYKILYLLMSNAGKVFSIDEIYEKVWNEPAYNPDTVAVHIRRIREKLEINPKEPKYLKVVWGIGYKFESE